MNISVFVESQEDKRYCATCLTLPGFVAEAATREEALEQMRVLVQQQLSRGELVHLEVPLQGEPQTRKSLGGMWKDHPDIDEVVENMLEYRRQVDADPDRP